MHRIHRGVLAPLAFGLVLLAVGAGISSASSSRTTAITPSPAYSASQLDAYAGNDWLSNGGDLSDDRYSTLKGITSSNVGKLTQAWHIHLGECAAYQAANAPIAPGVPATCPGQEANAVVANGVMYIASSMSKVFAYDATNGNLIWQYTPTFDPGFNIGTGGRQPGVSVGQGFVFLGQRDGKVVALNQINGAVAWTQTLAPWQKGVRLSETPMYYNGEVIEGTSGADGGSTSNQMMALNATSGALLWSWSIIPNYNQPGGNTWPWSGTGANYGGGAMWENPSIDSKDGLVIFGTGNPVPWNSRGPGADLYTDSIIALNVNTGAFSWAYQTVRHDLWDSDLPNGTVQFNMKVNGTSTHVIADVAKFGWTWVLNAKTGKPVLPVKLVTVPTLTSPDVNTFKQQPIPQSPNTLSGCIGGDPTSYNGAVHCYDQPLKNGDGRLTTDPGRWTGLTAPDGKPYKIGSHFDPYDTTQYVTAPFESMDWPSSSYDPVTQSFITCGVTNRTYGKEQVPAASQIVGSAGGIGAGILSVADSSIDPLNLNDFGNFSALNMNTVSPSSGGKWAWHQIWNAPCYSGTVNTASGLTFVGHLGQGSAQNGLGYLAAVDTKTGKELWQSPLMDAPAASPPITYSVNGVQYVSILSGGEGHNDPTRPNPSVPNQRVRGDSIYTYVLGS
jgi:quinohemoprotein ethanol dehydrogenase